MSAEVIWTAGFYFAVFFSGVLLLATGVKAWEVWRARNWIPVPGRIIQAGVESRRLRNRRGPSEKQYGNFPEIVYEYRIEGKVFKGKQVNVTPHLPDVEVQPVLERYPVGTPVTVFYNPANVKECVLEKDWPVGLGLGVIGLLGFILAVAYGVPWVLTLAESELALHIPHPDRSWFVVLCAAAGIFLVWLYAAIQLDQQRAKQWPSVKGTIVSAHIEAFLGFGRGNGAHRPVHFRPVVLYQYQVGNHVYEGDRISFTGGTTGAVRSASREEDVMIIDRTDGRAATYAPFRWMIERMKKYRPETEVDVYYDPAQPTNSVIERDSSGPYWVLIFAAGFLTLAIWMALI